MPNRNRVSDDQKIVRMPSAANGARRGTGKYARIAAVLRSRTVRAALRAGARRSTVRFCRERRLIRLEG